MSRSRRQRGRSVIPQLPADLGATLVLVLLVNLAVFAPVLNESPVRAILGILYVLFLPGYALVAALFPEASRQAGSESLSKVGPPRNTQDSAQLTQQRRASVIPTRTVDGAERAALSFALSLVVVPLIALGVTLSPIEFGFLPTLLSIDAFVIVCTVIAGVRRWRLPAESRFRVPFREWSAATKRAVTGPDSRLDMLLNVGLIIAILFAVGSLGLATVAPPDGEQFTEFYVLTEADDGELVAADYPQSLTPGEPESLHVGIENQEGTTVDYEVVVQLRRPAEATEDADTTDRAHIGQFSRTLAHNESWTGEIQVIPPGELTGSDLQLTFLLYKGDVPPEPTQDNAYRALHLWVDVNGESD